MILEILFYIFILICIFFIGRWFVMICCEGKQDAKDSFYDILDKNEGNIDEYISEYYNQSDFYIRKIEK